MLRHLFKARHGPFINDLETPVTVETILPEAGVALPLPETGPPPSLFQRATWNDIAMETFKIAVLCWPFGRLPAQFVLYALLLIIEQPTFMFQPLHQLLFKSSSPELPKIPDQLPVDRQCIYFNGRKPQLFQFPDLFLP